MNTKVSGVSQAEGQSDELDESVVSAELQSMLSDHLAYQRTAPMSEIKTELLSLRAFDRHQESRQQFHRARLIVFIFLVLVVGLVLFWSTTLQGIPFFAMIGVCVAGLVASTILAIQHGTSLYKHSRLNLDDKRYEVVIRLLRLIELDARPEETLQVRIDFGKHDRRELLSREGTAGHWQVKYYVDPWLQMAGRFRDGTKFAIGFSEKIQHRSRWKRSRSGKQKYKSKSKSGEQLNLVLRPKSTRYQNLSSLINEFEKSLRLPPYVTIKSFQPGADNISLKVEIRGDNQCQWRTNDSVVSAKVKERVDLVAVMLLGIFETLNHCRELQKRQ